MAASGLLIDFFRDRGLIREPRRPVRILSRHDTKVLPRARFLDEAGVAMSLTGLTVRYTLRELGSQALVVNRQTVTAENQSTNVGECYYPLTAGQVANAVEGIEEWTIDHGSGISETFPVGLPQVVRIVADVDNV